MAASAPRALDDCDSQVMTHTLAAAAVGKFAVAGEMLAEQVVENSLLEQVGEVHRSAQTSSDSQPPMPARSSPRWTVADAGRARKLTAWVRCTVVVPGTEIGLANNLGGSHSTPDDLPCSVIQVGRPVTDTEVVEAAFGAAAVQTEEAGTAGWVMDHTRVAVDSQSEECGDRRHHSVLDHTPAPDPAAMDVGKR